MNINLLRSLTNGDLHKFKFIVINSGNGYQVKLPVEEVTRVEIYYTGMICIEKKDGDISYFYGADMSFKQK
jgi:hypothetical protein